MIPLLNIAAATPLIVLVLLVAGCAVKPPAVQQTAAESPDDPTPSPCRCNVCRCEIRDGACECTTDKPVNEPAEECR